MAVVLFFVVLDCPRKWPTLANDLAGLMSILANYC